MKSEEKDGRIFQEQNFGQIFFFCCLGKMQALNLPSYCLHYMMFCICLVSLFLVLHEVPKKKSKVLI